MVLATALDASTGDFGRHHPRLPAFLPRGNDDTSSRPCKIQDLPWQFDDLPDALTPEENVPPQVAVPSVTSGKVAFHVAIHPRAGPIKAVVEFDVRRETR